MLLRLVAIILTLPLLLGACRPQEPDINPAPTGLLVSDRLDSVITLDDQRDFSGIVPTGQGPKGSLIRWDIKSSVGSQSFATFTYDQKNRLVGKFEFNYGYGQQEVRQAYYEGGYLSFVQTAYLKSPSWEVPRSQAYLQSLSAELTTVQPVQVIKYQYDKAKQLKQILFYQLISDTWTYRLEQLIQLEYNATGQLHLTRKINRSRLGSVAELNYWQDGDRIREETVYPPNPVNPNPVVTTSYTYSQEHNPFFELSLAPDILQSQHNPASITYTLNNMTQVDQPVFNRTYNAQGQLISQTVGNEKGSGYWLGYTFSYAP